MDTLMRYRFFNKYRILLISLFVLGMFLTWFFNSNMYEYVFAFDYHAEDLANEEIAKEVRDQLIEDTLKFDYFIAYSYEFTGLLTPFLAGITAIIFMLEKRSVFHQKYIRGQKQSSVIWSSIFWNALFTAVWMYAAYVIYCLIGTTFNQMTIEIERNTFDAIFGAGFSKNHLLLYHLTEGFVKFFIFTFIYSFFSCAICLVTNKSYIGMTVPMIYFLCLTVLFSIVSHVRFLSPAFTLSFSSYYGLQPWEIFVPLIIPILLSVGIILYSLKRSEKVIG